eukprot:COSAG03_NODE_736_length_6038_cov_155.990908_4_plen_82_part_00
MQSVWWRAGIWWEPKPAAAPVHARILLALLSFKPVKQQPRVWVVFERLSFACVVTFGRCAFRPGRSDDTGKPQRSRAGRHN